MDRKALETLQALHTESQSCKRVEPGGPGNPSCPWLLCVPTSQLLPFTKHG